MASFAQSSSRSSRPRSTYETATHTTTTHTHTTMCACTFFKSTLRFSKDVPLGRSGFLLLLLLFSDDVRSLLPSTAKWERERVRPVYTLTRETINFALRCLFIFISPFWRREPVLVFSSFPPFNSSATGFCLRAWRWRWWRRWTFVFCLFFFWFVSGSYTIIMMMNDLIYINANILRECCNNNNKNHECDWDITNWFLIFLLPLLKARLFL